MLMCDHIVSFDNFKVLVSSKPELHLKNQGQPFNITWPTYFELKNHYICLFFVWLFSYYKHSYIAISFLLFSIIKYPSVSNKILIKICFWNFGSTKIWLENVYRILVYVYLKFIFNLHLQNVAHETCHQISINMDLSASRLFLLTLEML